MDGVCPKVKKGHKKREGHGLEKADSMMPRGHLFAEFTKSPGGGGQKAASKHGSVSLQGLTHMPILGNLLGLGRLKDCGEGLVQVHLCVVYKASLEGTHDMGLGEA